MPTDKPSEFEKEMQRMNALPLSGPWQKVKDENGTRIFTAWRHPQLDAPAPVVNIGVTIQPGMNERIIVMREADADLIVVAPMLRDFMLALEQQTFSAFAEWARRYHVPFSLEWRYWELYQVCLQAMLGHLKPSVEERAE